MIILKSYHYVLLLLLYLADNQKFHFVVTLVINKKYQQRKTRQYKKLINN